MDKDLVERVATPRKLGGEWENWNGVLEENNGDLDTSPWYFISFALLSITIISTIIALLIYLTIPRLLDIHPLLGTAMTVTGTGCIVLLYSSLICVILTLLTKKPFVFFFRNKEIANWSIVPYTLKLGQKFGFSPDRLKNSLLKIGNAITKALYTQVKPNELLILVPRCLSKLMREELNRLTEQYGISYYTASGGNAAREMLIRFKPRAVIGVACERDLIAGIQDVGGSIPVLAIANKRPDGPCINTHISIQEMEEAIQFFLGR